MGGDRGDRRVLPGRDGPGWDGPRRRGGVAELRAAPTAPGAAAVSGPSRPLPARGRGLPAEQRGGRCPQLLPVKPRSSPVLPVCSLRGLPPWVPLAGGAVPGTPGAARGCPSASQLGTGCPSSSQPLPAPPHRPLGLIGARSPCQHFPWAAPSVGGGAGVRTSPWVSAPRDPSPVPVGPCCARAGG